MKINRMVRQNGKWLVEFTVKGKRLESISRYLGDAINLAFQMERWEK